MRTPQRCLQNVIAGDDLILRKAPPAVHPSDARILAGEILLQPRKPFFCFHFYNTVAEKAVLCQQVKEIARQHTEGAAGDDVGGIVGGGGALLFPDFCVVLFQHGGQRCELRRLQLRKVLPVPKHQIAARDTPGGELFLRDLAVALCRIQKVLHIAFVLHLPGQEGQLVQQTVKVYLVVDVLFIGLAFDDIFHGFVPSFPYPLSPSWETSLGFVVRSLYSSVVLGNSSLKGRITFWKNRRPLPGSALVT